MKNMRKVLAVVMVAVLSLVSIVSCGEEEKTVSETPRGTLKSEASVIASEGGAWNCVSELSGKVKTEKTADQWETENRILEGDFDFAVLTPSEAARLHNMGAEFRVVTTLAEGEWNIMRQKDEVSEEDMPEEGVLPDMSVFSGLPVYALRDDPYKDQAEYEQQLADASAESEDPAVEDTEDEKTANMPEDVTEMSSIIWSVLMIEGKAAYSDSQIQWIDSEQAEEYASDGSIWLMGSKANLSGISSTDTMIPVVEMAESWKLMFRDPIPAYVLVASDRFIEKRGDEMEGMLDQIEDDLDANQKKSSLKLMSYAESNRGALLCRNFIETVEKYLPGIFGEEKITADLYWNSR